MRKRAIGAACVAIVLAVLSSAQGYAAWVYDGLAISTAGGNQTDPTIVSDGAGGAIIMWIDIRSGNNDIYAQRVNASGAVLWTIDGVALCTAVGEQWRPAIISDGTGGAIVTWQDFRHGWTNCDIYAQRVNASGAVQWTADGVALSTATYDQSSPAIVSDGEGGAMVAWQDTRVWNCDIYAQRVNASGAVQWTADGVALCTNPNNQTEPQITSDGAGGAIVTWPDDRGGTYYDIYAQRVNASGVVQWTANGVALCTATGDQYYRTITSDGAGGAIVTWQDSRSGSSSDIYGQLVNASGAVQWTADGVALCTATGNQQYPTITSDGAGGAIVTWHDQRSGNYDIYAQRVNASGAVQWTANGVALCTATGEQWNPTITSDEAGGAIVTWYDYRSGNYDTYAERVNASGAVQWTANGVALCTATGNQQYPTITSDGAGGAIVTWYDQRSGDYDIYAQRIDATGNQPIATMLQRQSSSVSDRGITVTWTLAEMDADVEFFILRAAQGASDFDELSATNLAREGLSFVFVDSEVAPGTTYTYHVDIQMGRERKTLFETGPIKMPAMPVTLYQNQPNPFNPSTAIRFYLPEQASVTLDIYDSSGRVVATLIENEPRSKGYQEVSWAGTDRAGRSLPSAVYFYRLSTAKETKSRKMILLR